MGNDRFQICLPRLLEEVLRKDRGLYGAVLLSLQEFEPWFRMSGTPFFPEYTGHGLEHVEDVLRTADSLIPDEARGAVTSADAAVLILGTLVHDAAMHLTKDGFVALVSGNAFAETMERYGDRPWPVLWEDFVAEAKRFSGRKLTALFGDTEPVHRPALDPSKLAGRECLLIGEFIRRHHHRLAHEIARHGVPNAGGVCLRFKEVPDDFADLAGLVARSHGIPIRSCLDNLKSDFDLREYKKVHAVYLMALLRVADYLQVQAERAPRQVLQVKILRSPVSQREWKAHAAVRDVRHTHEDPEAIFIDAQPGDVETFLRLQEWLSGIQNELDRSWAVLGEVYGRYDGLNTLARISHHMDDSS